MNIGTILEDYNTDQQEDKGNVLLLQPTSCGVANGIRGSNGSMLPVTAGQ